eukprot:498686-Amphidinium_carterae.2
MMSLSAEAGTTSNWVVCARVVLPDEARCILLRLWSCTSAFGLCCCGSALVCAPLVGPLEASQWLECCNFQEQELVEAC